MKDLGCMNGWYAPVYHVSGWDSPTYKKEEDKIPQEYLHCVSQKRPLVVANKGRCWTQYTCPICGITFDVDSSD